jgi:uncharacterized protein (DUF2336 family)
MLALFRSSRTPMADDLHSANPAAGGAAKPDARARLRLTRRLADIVCLPETRVSPQERWMTADVLEALLHNAAPDLRAKVAERLADQGEAPAGLLRRLALDDFTVAEPILRRSAALTDFDMMEIARKGGPNHQLALARREHVSETVAAALASSGGPDVIAALLRNPGARLAPQTTDFLVRELRESDRLAELLIKRPELRPAQAFALFWSVSHPLRRQILERFSVSRAILQEAAADVFPLAAQAGAADRDVAEALRYIDRRQRDRAAADRSVYGSLERAVEEYASRRDDIELQSEIARLAGIRVDLAERVLSDMGGEPIAVLAKATGLSRAHLERVAGAPGEGALQARAEQAQLIFDTLSVDKAQTVLRYWNWVFERGRAD